MIPTTKVLGTVAEITKIIKNMVHPSSIFSISPKSKADARFYKNTISHLDFKYYLNFKKDIMRLNSSNFCFVNTMSTKQLSEKPYLT